MLRGDTMEGTPENGAPENDGTQPQGGTQDAPPEKVVFEQWFETLNDAQKDAIDDHITGLRSALSNEREGRKALEKQIRELSKKADAGSDLQKQLETISNDLTVESQRASFYEQAHTAGVKNLRLAWLAVQADKLIGPDGTVDLAKLRETAPEVFAPSKPLVPQGNAGTSAGNPPPAQKSMNDFLRTAAGIKV